MLHTALFHGPLTASKCKVDKEKAKQEEGTLKKSCPTITTDRVFQACFLALNSCWFIQRLSNSTTSAGHEHYECAPTWLGSPRRIPRYRTNASGAVNEWQLCLRNVRNLVHWLIASEFYLTSESTSTAWWHNELWSSWFRWGQVGSIISAPAAGTSQAQFFVAAIQYSVSSVFHSACQA